MIKIKKPKSINAANLARAEVCTVNEFREALRLQGAHANRVINAIYNLGSSKFVTGAPFYMSTKCPWDKDYCEHVETMNLNALRRAVADKTILRMRNFGQICYQQLCSVLGMPYDSRPRCPHCGQVWYSDNGN
jgi:hypothetical protein